MIKSELCRLVDEIAASAEVAARGLHFLPTCQAIFNEPIPGNYLFTWSDPNPGDRLKLTYAYRDRDGTPVLISCVFRENESTEVEIARGDGKPIINIPNVTALFVPPVGVPF